MRRQLAPGKPVARRFQRHLANRVTFFQQRLSSGRIEGLHNKLPSLVEKACGDRNPERFQTAIFFHLGGRNRYPVPQ